MNGQTIAIGPLPDLSMTRYIRHGRDRQRLAAGALATVLGQLTPEREEWLGLGYHYKPKEPTPQDRLKIFVRVQTEALAGGNGGAFPGAYRMREFFSWQPVQAEEAMGKAMDERGGYVLRLRPAEEIFLDEERDHLYYAPVPWTMEAVADFLREQDGLFDMLCSPCRLSIHLRPTVLQSPERETLVRQIEELGRWASGFDPERRDTGSIAELAREKGQLARRHAEIYQEYFEQLFTGPCYSCAIWIASTNEREAALVAKSLGLALAPSGRFEIERHGPDSRHYESIQAALAKFAPYLPLFEMPGGIESYSQRLADGAGTAYACCPERFRRAAILSRLGTLLTPEAAAKLVRLPISMGEYKKTIRIESEIEEGSANNQDSIVNIGPRLDRLGPAWFQPDDLVTHLLATGASGSGKTVTLAHILKQLWEKFAIPFLVLVPILNPYRILFQLGGRLARDLRVYTPGCGLSPWQFNPFEVPAGVVIGIHISRLMTAFAGAIEMVGPLESLIGQAIEKAYRAKGLRPTDVGQSDMHWPVMRDVVRAMRQIMAEGGYIGEVRMNIQAAIENRFVPLCEGLVGQVFSAPRSNPSIGELRRHPVMIELASLNPVEQNLLNLFCVNAQRQEAEREGPSKSLRHFLLIEEAGNLLGVHTPRQTTEGRADPSEHNKRMLMKILTEARDLGQGIGMIHQNPADLPPTILKNAQIKLAHRTVEREEREILAGVMGLSDAECEDLMRLRPGELFVIHERLYRPARARSVNLTEDLDRPDDEAVFETIREQEWYREATGRRMEGYRTSLNHIISAMEDLGEALAGLARTKTGRGRLVRRRGAVLKAVNQAADRLEDVLGLARLDRGVAGAWPDLAARYRVAMRTRIERLSAIFRGKENDDGTAESDRMAGCQAGAGGADQ